MKGNSKEYCYICGNIAAERDHFPVPECLGGTDTLPICRGCHDEKDRSNLGDWNASDAFAALHAIWERATVRERLVITKLVSVTAHAIHASRARSATQDRRVTCKLIELGRGEGGHTLVVGDISADSMRLLAGRLYQSISIDVGTLTEPDQTKEGR